MNHETFMHEALELAKEAQLEGELPFGAVIVRDGQVIAGGRCRESHEKSVLAHAELEAVDKACRALATTKLTDCVIYCTSEPCPMCAAAIFQAKIPHVIIGTSRKDLTFMRPRKIDLQALADDSGYVIEITRDVFKQEVMKLFKDKL